MRAGERAEGRLMSRVALVGSAIRSRLERRDSRLFVVGDGSGWVLNHEARQIHGIAQQLGIRSSLVLSGSTRGITRQRLFHMSHFVLPRIASSGEALENRVAIAYLHGRPEHASPEFVACFDALRAVHRHLWRIQVSCRLMEDFVLTSGIDAHKVQRIPIGIDLDVFAPWSADRSAAAREALGLPAEAVVVGSFQKDGDGWGAGDMPKLIKGPDVLLAVLEQLREHVPNLWVLLSGAARGFVRRGLDQLGIPYVYRWLDDYSQIGALYHASDVVLVTSREEGGPKAVLESMASGVPLVSTRVGQAPDLVQHSVNGWLADVGDVESLVRATVTALRLSDTRRAQLQHAARATAEANSYERQRPQWREFFA